MSEPSKYPNFTASDIERYHTGQMSDRERNAIEKAALEDPFLSDAIEGYLFTSSPAADLESIKKRLTEKSPNKKYTIPFFRHNSFMKIAAIVLLVAGAGWFITQITSSSDQDIAVNKDRESIPESTIRQDQASTGEKLADPVVSDTLSSTRDLVVSEPVTQKKSDQKSSAISTTEPLNNINKSKEPVKEESNIKAEIATATAAAPVTMNAKMQPKDSTFSIAASDIYGVEIRGDSIKNLNIVMVENDQVLNEVVVLNRRQNRGVANQAKPIEEIEPVGGWEGYNNYALNNLKPPEGYDNKIQTGDVVLSFDINEEGDPTNIKIVESYCSSCEKEARRILQEGPKWKNKNKRNAKIRIRF